MRRRGLGDLSPAVTAAPIPNNPDRVYVEYPSPCPIVPAGSGYFASQAIFQNFWNNALLNCRPVVPAFLPQPSPVPAPPPVAPPQPAYIPQGAPAPAVALPSTAKMLTPFYLNPFTRDTWSEYDAYVIAQMEAALCDECYKPKIYKSPDISQEVLAATGPGAYVSHGLKITPGALIVGFLFPSNFLQTEVNVQITDVGLGHKWYSEPVPWVLLSNGKPFMPNLLRKPYPVVDPGRFLVELWNVSGAQFRAQLRFLVLEPRA